MTTRFGEFVLDPHRRQLFRGEKGVHLTPKAFELLGLLLEKRPEAVGKDALESRVWGKTHVAETSLAGLVAELRRALGDPGRPPRFIRTVHGFGYAFCGAAVDAGAAEAEAPAAGGQVYRISWQRREVSLRPGVNLLGRDADAVAWIDSPTVSRRHARIVVGSDDVVIEDLRSRNGTFVGGRKVEGPVQLHDRDEIRLGSVTMTFRAWATSETESAPR
ncbi:MAG TPA: FHA domain-containing protein [Vicinamibacteria bacterium]|jgi:DNA-binding winged helix-turn-helix (wHTH) protein